MNSRPDSPRSRAFRGRFCGAPRHGRPRLPGGGRVPSRQSRLAHARRRPGGLLAHHPAILSRSASSPTSSSNRPSSASWRSASPSSSSPATWTSRWNRSRRSPPWSPASCSAPAASGSASRCTPEWLVMPVSLAHRPRRRRHHRRHQRPAGGSAQDERLHRDARLLYLGARPGGGDLRRPLGPGSGAFAALHGHRDHRLHPADRLDGDRLLSRFSPSSWRRRRSAGTSP